MNVVGAKLVRGKYHVLLITATLSLFLVLPFIFTACGGGTASTSTAATTTTPTATSHSAVVSGQLTVDAATSSAEVSNATVYVIGQEANKTTTDANGNYTLVIETSSGSIVTQKPFTRAVVASNKYGVIAQSASTLHGKKFEVTADPEDTLTGQSASLAKVGSITGNAKMQSQADHTGIMVYIPGTSFIALTDAGGSYAIGNVPPGTYPFLRAEKSGYKYAMLANVAVNANAATAADNMQLLLDTGAAGSMVIDAGLGYVVSRSVTLSIAATSSAVLMMIAEDVNFIGASWETLQTTKAYTFASDGAKTLYIKFADVNGLESAPFTASVLVDTTAPTVASTSPANGAVNVNRNTPPVSVTFSEAMDASTITNGTITLNNGAACTVTYDANANTATCTPTASLAWGTVYTLSLSSAIKDNHGLSLTATTISFTATYSVSKIAAGYSHTIALKSDGTLWAWGWNPHGELGDGTQVNKSTPTQIGTATNWTTIAAGAYHTIALKSDGTLWAWGGNGYGQLGDGTTADKTSPTQIGTATNWTAIEAGDLRTIALKSDGTLWAWGDNGYGQLGDGTTVYKTSPTQIGAATNWTAIAAGYSHTIALKSDGTLWAWGDNGWGQLGDGTTVNKSTPTQIGVATNWIAIAAGYSHTIALKSDGTLWAWGRNWEGELGDGTTVNKSTPTQIGTATNWTAIAAGAYHTIALKSDGTLWAWGYNEWGQLGDGTTVNKSTPTQIGTATNWIAIAAGDYHTIALKSDGTLWAWGENADGRLGDGTTVSKTSPTAIIP